MMRSLVLPALAVVTLAACATSPSDAKAGFWHLAGEENLKLCADSLKQPGGSCDAKLTDGRLLVEGDSTGAPRAFVRFILGTGETTKLRFASVKDSLTRALGEPKCAANAVVWRKDGLDLMLTRRGTDVSGHGAGTPSWAVVIGVGPADPHSVGGACPPGQE